MSRGLGMDAKVKKIILLFPVTNLLSERESIRNIHPVNKSSPESL